MTNNRRLKKSSQCRKSRESAKVPTRRVAVYTRKSVEKGLEQEYNSLHAQRDRIVAYVEAKAHEGWEIADTIYDDGGFSGKNTKRPGFEQLMDDVRSGRVQVVAVYKFDRLSRSLADFTRVLAEFEDHGVEFVSVTQDLDSSTPVGRMIVNILASFAQFEREMISERTSDKIRATRMKGLWTGGHAPYGFKVIEKRLVANPELLDRVQAIFDLYLELGGISSTVRELNRRGWKTIKGCRWSKSGLHHMLRNPTYIGRIPLHGEDFEGQHDGIIDEDVFHQVQVMLDSQGPESKEQTRNKWEMLLRGHIHCAQCGEAMQHSFSKKAKKLYHYYRCDRNDPVTGERCQKAAISAPMIEDFVVERIKERCRDERVVESAIRQAKATEKARVPVIKQELATIARQTAQVSRQRERLVLFQANDDADPEATRANLGALREEAEVLAHRKEELLEQIDVLQEAPRQVEQLRQAIEEFLPLWGQLTVRERIRVLGLLVERIEYDGRSDEVEVFYLDFDADDMKAAG